MLSRIPGARLGRSWITAVGRSQRALASDTQELVLMEPLREKGVALLTLNRPKALNALSDGLMRALAEKLQQVDGDSTLRAAVVTGTGKAFAAGADIKEMHSRSDYSDVRHDNMLAHWSAIASIRKPIVAAVGGFALGGGCELAMSCDIIIASEAAKFGQPEIKLGTIPGVGGTQRLVRAIGKSKAMELVLTGEMLSAEEAEKAGLVSRVVAQGAEVEEALRVAEKIASFSSPVVQLAKECINASQELSLTEGLRLERHLFHGTWGLKDRQEGFQAFIDKRLPTWKHS